MLPFRKHNRFFLFYNHFLLSFNKTLLQNHWLTLRNYILSRWRLYRERVVFRRRRYDLDLVVPHRLRRLCEVDGSPRGRRGVQGWSWKPGVSEWFS